MASPALISIDPDSPAFDSLDEAAAAIAAKFGAGRDMESAAMIYRDASGKFRYSTIIPGRADQFALRAQIPKGAALAGIVHSHPGADAEGQVFSPNDLQIANQLKLPSYIRFLAEGQVRKYTPGVTATSSSRLNSRFSGTHARGDELPKPAKAQLSPPESATKAVLDSPAAKSEPQPEAVKQYLSTAPAGSS